MISVLEFETEDFTLSIEAEDKRKQKTAFLESSLLNKLDNCNYVLNTTLKNVQILGNNEPIVSKKLSFQTDVLFFENGTYNFRLESKHPIYKFNWYSNRKEEEAFIDKIDGISCHKISYMNYVGLTRIYFSYLISDQKKSFCFEFCVYPLKLKYISDFNAILNDIIRESINLNFSLLSKTSFSFFIDRYYPNHLHDTFSDIVWLQLFLNLSKKLIHSCNIILEHPQSQLKMFDRLIPNRKLKVFSPSLYRNNNENIIITKANTLTYDTIENRYIKYTLKWILSKLNCVKNSLIESKQLSDGYKNNIEHCIKSIEKFLSSNIFSNIPLKNIHIIHSTPIFEKKNGYNSFFQCIKILQGNNLCPNDQIQLRIKQICSLYEMWSFILIKNILCELLGDNVRVKEKDENLFVGLLQGKMSKIQISNSLISIDLYYNPTISREYSDVDCLYSLTEEQRPDILLKIKFSEKELYVVFDAKYRYKIKNENEFHPVADGINQIHRYRDSIVKKDSIRDTYSKAIWGGLVLFPGYNNIDEVKTFYYFTSIKHLNIGALQIIPTNQSSIGLLKQILSSLCCTN